MRNWRAQLTLGVTSLAFACSPDTIAADGSDGSESEETGEEPVCEHPLAAVEFDLLGPPDNIIGDEVTVAMAEQDTSDPGHWTFAFHAIEDDVVLGIELRSDPPLAVPPFEIGDRLSIGFFSFVQAGWSFEFVELADADGLLVSLRSSYGPPGFPAQAPFTSVFDFEWTPLPRCTRSELMCTSADELRLEILQFPDTPVAQLGPDQRHIVFQAVVEGEGQSYELWLGDTWRGECGGSATESKRHAVFRQP